MSTRMAVSFRSRQRGLATILTITLLSVALIATSASMVYTLKGAKEWQVAEHAQTHAQASVWSAAEHLRRYLMSLDSSKLDSLVDDFQNNGGSLNWDIEDETDNDIDATIKNVETKTVDGVSGHAVTAEVSVVDDAAKSSSHIEVVYAVLPEVIDEPMLGGNTNFTNVGSNIIVEPGEKIDIKVDGDITTSSSSIGGSELARFTATGNIELDSAIEADEVFSNKNVTITGGSQPDVIFAVGEVSMSGGTDVKQIYANGKVTIDGGEVEVSIDSRSDILLNSGGAAHGIATAKGNIDIQAGSAEEANAVGNIDIHPWQSVDMVRSQSDVTCHSGAEHGEIHAAGSVNGCNVVQSGVIEDNAQPAPTVNVMDELQPVSFDKPIIDAWVQKSKANYVFEEDGNKLKVTVSDVNGLTDGVYYLGTYPSHSSDREYLCETVNASNECTSPSYANARTICQGFSQYNSCFSFDSSAEKWTLDGLNLAPGVLWFKGNLELNNGEYYNSFIATGDISTGGSLEVMAVNAAGADVICDNNYPANPTNDFDGLHPVDSCKQSAGVSSLVPRKVGNVALMAGGYDPNDAQGTYSGGKISLGSGNKITGLVLAGDNLHTQGNTTIHGNLVAAGLGGGENEISGSTTLDFTDPGGDWSALVPDSSGGNHNNSSGGANRVSLFWSRYM